MCIRDRHKCAETIDCGFLSESGNYSSAETNEGNTVLELFSIFLSSGRRHRLPLRLTGQGDVPDLANVYILISETP